MPHPQAQKVRALVQEGSKVHTPICSRIVGLLLFKLQEQRPYKAAAHSRGPLHILVWVGYMCDAEIFIMAVSYVVDPAVNAALHALVLCVA